MNFLVLMMFYLSVNPQSPNFRKQTGDSEKVVSTRLICKFNSNNNDNLLNNNVIDFQVFES